MAEVYEIKRFLKLVKDGYIIDYDGIGYFGNKTTEFEPIRNVDVQTIKKGMNKYTHVHWYNR